MDKEAVVKESESEVAQSCPTLCHPMDWSLEPGRLQSMEFSRQEYWSGLPFPSPGDLPDPGIEPRSPALQVDALTSEPPGKLSHKKEHIWVSSNEVDELEPIIQSEISEKEKDKYHIPMHIYGI